MTLERVIDRLLHSASLRERFLRGDRAWCELSTEDADALCTLDAEQLERFARSTCLAIFERSNRGAGSLKQAFGRTIARWLEQHPAATIEDLAHRFAESSELEGCALMPVASGTCLEEAFFRFAVRCDLGDAFVRWQECAIAVIRALAVTPRPSFRVPDFVRRGPGGYFVVLEQGPILVAAVNGALVQGRISPFVAALLTSADAPLVLARRFDVPLDALEDAIRELRRLGLWVSGDQP